MFWLADPLIHITIHHKRQGGRHIWRHSVLSPSPGSAPLVGMNKPGKFSKPHFRYLKSFKNNTYSRAMVKSDLNNRCYIVAIHKCHLDPLPANGEDLVERTKWQKGAGPHRGGFLTLSALEIQSVSIVSIVVSLLPITSRKGEQQKRRNSINFYHLGPQIVVPVTFFLEHISPRAEPS